MAAIHKSQTGSLAGSRKLFFTSIFKFSSCALPHLHSVLRYSSISLHVFWMTLLPRCCSTLCTKKMDDGDDDADEICQNLKPKSPTNTKMAGTMARLINGTPWSGDLESSLSSLSPSLSKTTVLQTLKLIRAPNKALSFFKWVHLNGFTHNDQSYFIMLEILGRSRNLNAARNLLFSIERSSGGAVKLEDRFFNILIRSYGRAGLFQESIKVFMAMKEIGVSPSVITFNCLFSILLKRGRTNMAKNVYDEMLRTYGVTPDTYTFNILIRGFCINSMVDEGFHFFKEMSRYKCEPDVVTYNTLIDGLCRDGKVRIAHNLLKGMCKKCSNVSPNVVSYTTLVRGYCMKQDIGKALNVFEEMVSRGLKPNRITYNTLLQGLCEAQNLDKIKEILEGTMGGGEFVPDTCTFNTLMNAHCNVGKLDEALKMFEKMLDLHIQPDSATYSVLIRNLCQRGDFERAEELFDELSKKQILLSDIGCKPLVAAYNPIFEYLCRNGKTKKAETVFRQLMKRGTQDPPSYKTLIMGHCREGTFEAGYELLVLMLRRDFLPDVEIYESLIVGLLQMNEPLLAYGTLEKMLKSSHLPKTSIFHFILAELLKKGCARESSSFVKLMIERKIRQNINLSTDTVVLLFKSGQWDKAYQTVGLLYDNGYSVKMEELIAFLCQHEKWLQSREMLLFSLEKHQSVDIVKCNTVIHGLCKIHKLSEAFSLYYELVEKGINQQLGCQEELRTMLESQGRLKEAEFIAIRTLKW
ncbi:pentatricopeptide repeat-containing protein At1g02060, chloroplastic [Malania oleifera]|uniref:pentatricopeptide repeat-containing protein At1g02060, chloroplastic n=1 Tax=Malania oleifera TaxID=397392 RepID=UPI0025AE10BA|nr:pentatricopeptide repeat-containing protein At1g02060, chloroplastic [Malania oleifera]XP_057971721.1 pentatricopeptide repeat-containing protein At1g02060, chloroplastic [Malania oleifera]XP_057971722.1 pentatricopeptide repeat-containing protein At1g02060, chloroplastic [Malania oleifera]XP_057971723.1 pentatricopeptide repeat-containing protein At1g02060, chloroplastic [Malania oleifera]XP_057971724.1 pentatricopeptide repeat-containing protein At1g02060, chloroplastic [Malania oleifera]